MIYCKNNKPARILTYIICEYNKQILSWYSILHYDDLPWAVWGSFSFYSVQSLGISGLNPIQFITLTTYKSKVRLIAANYNLNSHCNSTLSDKQKKYFTAIIELFMYSMVYIHHLYLSFLEILYSIHILSMKMYSEVWWRLILSTIKKRHV